MKKLIIAALCFLGASAQAAEQLEGRWAQYCQQGAKREEVFTEDKATLVEKYYLDVNCQTLEAEIENAGTFEADAEFRYPDQKIQNMDFTYDAVRVTLYSDRYVTYYNDHKMCGIGDWKKGEAKEITGLRCEFFQRGRTVQIPMKNDMRYGIFMVQGTRLYLGQLMPGFDGSTPERRPYLLDNRYFVKMAE